MTMAGWNPLVVMYDYASVTSRGKRRNDDSANAGGVMVFYVAMVICLWVGCGAAAIVLLWHVSVQ